MGSGYCCIGWLNDWSIGGFGYWWIRRLEYLGFLLLKITERGNGDIRTEGWWMWVGKVKELKAKGGEVQEVDE